jgi:hypothetical protein
VAQASMPIRHGGKAAKNVTAQVDGVLGELIV